MSHPCSHLSSFRNTCFKCNASWGGCHCPDVSEDEGFEWEGTNIINPVVSECGRFFVDPVLHYGKAYLVWASKRWHNKLTNSGGCNE